jgi:hypothetical protein
MGFQIRYRITNLSTDEIIEGDPAVILVELSKQLLGHLEDHGSLSFEVKWIDLTK